MTPYSATMVHDVLAHYLAIDPDEVTTDDDLARDWGMDDLDLILVALELEDAFASEFPMARLEEVTTVRSLVDLVRAWLASVARPALARAS